MKLKNLLIVSILFCCFSCKSQSKKINGISYVASGEAITKEHVNPVLKAQGNYVALMPFAFVRGLQNPKVNFNFSRQWFGETPKGIKQYANLFKEYNIKVMLKPQIWVSRGEYTGLIKMKTEEDWKILEKTYTDFILLFAKLAQEINAPILCIGTELENFVMQRPEFWRSLIKQIRKIYKGKLTYAANWDEFKRVPFWKELDFIGIDAYFPLTDKKNPTVKDFEKGWVKHKQEIINIQNIHKKPILFTEYGYRSVNFTGKEPWQANRVQGNVNLQAQVNGLRAIHNQFWKEDWFAGGFIWKWFVKHNRVGGKDNNRFTPQNKPAETLLKELYGH